MNCSGSWCSSIGVVLTKIGERLAVKTRDDCSEEFSDWCGCTLLILKFGHRCFRQARVSDDTCKERRTRHEHVCSSIEFPFCIVRVRWSRQVRCGSASPFGVVSAAQRLSAQVWFRFGEVGPPCSCHVLFGRRGLGRSQKVPSDGFLAESAEVQTKWWHFVASVDADPKNLHDVMFYAIVARTLAKVMGSAQPADYAEPHMRSLIGDGIKVGAAPF